MRFDNAFLDEIRARVPVSVVVSRRVPLKRAGREFKGLSPFKTEKTPSFTVNDQKAFYHCFATGEHGDIFKFLMTTEGLSFPEAVEQLAGEAGVPMPVQSNAPEDRARRDERTRLYDLMDAAQRFYRARLRSGAGRVAADYLAGRGLDAAIQEQFGLGFAPDDRGAMKAHLREAGFSEADAVSAGMLIGGEDIATPYDRFRNRVMFPITDLKGRVIAFGGRALSSDVPAKYLNSPETPLFHKGHVLYNAAGARKAAYDRGQIVVVEGYMDVIAMARAGVPNAVAPLGTALTEAQIAQLWRMADEPVLCFDGDPAGRKAAHRGIDTALPGLRPGLSLRFAFMPSGQDPDDLLKSEGAHAVGSVIDNAKPLADVLWDKEWASGDWSTPERRAQLEKTIRTAVSRIGDESVRDHYQREMSDRLFKAWRAQRSSPGYTGRGATTARQNAGHQSSQWSQTRGGHRAKSRSSTAAMTRGQAAHGATASSALLQSAIVRNGSSQSLGREALLLHALINHPDLIDEQLDNIAAILFTNEALSGVRDALLAAHAGGGPLDTLGVQRHLQRSGCEAGRALIGRLTAHKSDRFAEPEASLEEAGQGWLHTLALHNEKHLEDDVHRAGEDLKHDLSEQAFARLIDVQNQKAEAEGRARAGEDA
ncbi:MAG: DNA primase [Pseudomonadota bacterium]